MPLSEYGRILRRWGWILQLMALLTAGSAYVLSKAQTPIYKSTVVILVSPSRSDLGLTQSAKTLLRSYVTRVDSETFAQKVINELQLDTTAQALKNDVTIASDDSRFAIQIDVLNGNGDVAVDIARVWANEVKAWRDAENATIREEDKVRAVIVDEPTHYSQYRPNTKVNTLAGAILGLLLGGVIIFGIEYVESGVLRSPQDIERALELPVLGTIPPFEYAGARRRASRAG